MLRTTTIDEAVFGSKKSWVYKVRRSLRQPGFKT